jgi:glutamate dehydrogenase/leucine dehydrogenase
VEREELTLTPRANLTTRSESSAFLSCENSASILVPIPMFQPEILVFLDVRLDGCLAHTRQRQESGKEFLPEREEPGVDLSSGQRPLDMDSSMCVIPFLLPIEHELTKVLQYVNHMIEYAGQGSFKGKTVAISGSGNVAQYAALKAIELGATVVSLSDSKGALIATAESPITPEDVNAIAALKVKRQALTAYEGKHKYMDGARPWTHVKVDIALPCATQNEVSKEEAEALVASGARFIAEGSNMGCTQEAIEVFEANRREKKDAAIWYAPGKAANAGGVAVSGLEMAQNSQRLSWTSEEVDDKLKGIMEAAFKNGLETAKKYVKAGEGEYPSLVAGSNIAGFVKVAAAMHDQGDWW